MRSIRRLFEEEDAFPICDLGEIGAAIINSTFGCLIGMCAALSTMLAMLLPSLLQGK
jgi:hypothetical protein